MHKLRKTLVVGVGIVIGTAVVAATAWSSFVAITGTSPIVRFGSMMWIPVSEKTFFLPKPVRMALHRPVPKVSPGAFQWRALKQGFSVAELPVMSGAIEVDRILLARVDPKRFRFGVHNEATASTDINGWMRRTHALLVINGAYYGRDGGPATPTVIAGIRRGPKNYDARQGAFAASDGTAQLYDLRLADWREALRSAENGFISYPLLIAADGSNRAPRQSGWIANRSFVAEDNQGRILFGTTKGSFFSLYRLGEFLKSAPLDLYLALDLDGGPVACQAVAVGEYKRETCGHWEIQVDDAGNAKMLPTTWQFFKPPMPMAIAVYPRDTSKERSGFIEPFHGSVVPLHGRATNVALGDTQVRVRTQADENCSAASECEFSWVEVRSRAGGPWRTAPIDAFKFPWPGSFWNDVGTPGNRFMDYPHMWEDYNQAVVFAREARDKSSVLTVYVASRTPRNDTPNAQPVDIVKFALLPQNDAPGYRLSPVGSMRIRAEYNNAQEALFCEIGVEAPGLRTNLPSFRGVADCPPKNG